MNEQTSNSTYLITGALGHIGSSVMKSLKQSGSQLILVDDLSCQRYPSIFGFLNDKRVHFIKGKIQDPEVRNQVKKSLGESTTLKSVLHFAAQTDASSSFESAEQLMENNLNATRASVEIAAQFNVDFLFPSSTSVYGDSRDIVDETSTINPQSPYAECKLLEEETALEYSKSLVLRLGTIVGPSTGMRFHTAVNSFIWNALTNQPIKIWTTALDQFRPYLVLDDFVDAFRFLSKTRMPHGDIVNVLSENTTPRLITEEIAKILGPQKIQLVDSRIMNQLSYKVLNTKMAKLGFAPKKTVAKGIEDTISFLCESRAGL